MTTIDMKATLFNGYALTNADPKRWPTFDGQYLDRSQYVTASEVGKCARMVKLGKQGKPVPFKRWGFAERGHIIEAWAADLIRLGIDSGHTVMNTGNNQISFYDGAQSGTPDGIVRRSDGKYEILELKSIDPRTSLRNLPRKEHVKQVQQNMDLVSACWKVEVVGAHLMYINASDLQAIKQQYIPANHDVQAELERRSYLIMQANTPDDLQPEGMLVDKGCQYCDFKEKCSAMVASKKANAAEMKRLEGVAGNVFR